eukprot:15366716-Ditylum_brightwellii.AAC.4
MAMKVSNDLPTDEVDIGTLDTTNTDNKKKIAAGKQNILAMPHLIMTLGTELAYKLIEDLKEEYQPEDRGAAVEMKRKMSKVKMGKYDKPSKHID